MSTPQSPHDSVQELTEAGREKVFIELTSELQSYAFSLGAIWQDSVSIVEIVHKKSATFRTSLEDFISDCKAAVKSQVDINNTFISMWDTHQSAVKSAVKQAVKTETDADVESMVTDTFVRAMARLRDGSFEVRGNKETRAWLKSLARSVVSNWRAKRTRRADNVINETENNTDIMTSTIPNTYAQSYEDVNEASPDPKRYCPWGDES